MKKLPWKNEKEFYDLHSKKIFSNFNFYHVSKVGKTDLDFLNHIIKKARIFPNARVLDLGCGSGYVIGKLKDLNCDGIGISTSPECIKQAKKNFPNGNFQIGNMENYNFDNITHVLALESIGYSNIKITLKNIYKNLNKGGIFYIKDLFLKYNETDKEKENRIHWENYWKYKSCTIVELINIAYETGFRLIEFNDLSGKINNKEFLESLKYNLVKYEIPNPDVNFLIPAEFVFIK
jgi:cyclopropane fatty-acyl-phospholipid synthase-like methyltransferase